MIGAHSSNHATALTDEPHDRRVSCASIFCGAQEPCASHVQLNTEGHDELRAALASKRRPDD
jgi:hypothetical protein